MDEQQFRDALIEAGKERGQSLDHQLADVIQQRQAALFQVEQLTAEQHKLEGMMAECAIWLQGIREGRFIEVEVEDGPEGGG